SAEPKKHTMKKLPVLVPFFFAASLFAQNVDIEFFKGNFDDPVGMHHANDERLFVVEQGGLIKIIQEDGSVNTTPFLDVSGQISSGNERGLLGLAFHPDYANNGYFYINYTMTNGNTQV